MKYESSTSNFSGITVKKKRPQLLGTRSETSTSQYVFTKARFHSWRVPLKQFFILLSSYFYQSGAGGAVSLTV